MVVFVYVNASNTINEDWLNLNTERAFVSPLISKNSTSFPHETNGHGRVFGDIL
jgi:hypothetical protein